MDTTLRVPINGIRHELKYTQLAIERELQHLAQNKTLGRAELRSRVERLLVKARETQARVEALEQTLAARCEYTGELLPVYVAEYLLACEYPETARVLSRGLGIEEMVDFDIMAQCREISASILARDSSRVLEWAVANRQHLRKAGSTLEFDVRRQHFVHLASQDRIKAIAYSRKHLGKFYSTPHHASLASATLALVSPGTKSSKHGAETDTDAGTDAGTDTSGWVLLRDQFVRAFLEFHGKVPGVDLFELVTSGLAALRTHNCSHVRPMHSRYTHQSLKDHMCPACSQDLGQLALKVPYAHHIESVLDTDMVMLPNKRCYGDKLLREISSKSRLAPGKVYDPATLEVFEVSDLRRVFPT